MPISISFKVTRGKEFSISVEPDITVLELKQKCSEHVDIPVESQRIIFKGKILKDKETLTFYNVADGNTMHLVRSAIVPKEPEPEKENNNNENASINQNTNPADSVNDFNENPLVQLLMQNGNRDANNFNMGAGGTEGFNLGNFANLLNANGGGEFNRDSISSLLNNPLARSLINELSNNPEMLSNLISNNPLLRNTFSQSPLMQPVLENPNLLRELMRPEVLQAGLQFENAFNMNNPNNPNNVAMNPNANPTPTTNTNANTTTASNATNPGNNNIRGGLRLDDFINNFGAFVNTNNPSNPNNTTDNNNNPANNNLNALFQSPELLQTFQQMLGSNRNFSNFNFPGANQGMDFNAANLTDDRPPEEKYASQLMSLQEMGFIDNDANIQALQETGGDVNSAITRLLEKGYN
ncbi:ubiquitin domain-containing protein DSK2, putative [Hepatocystis sp. ex Piliocolobus tephrosceles]|nr:ubiquitin domain-containing protein DSK2, putative [Hepatocystis sp. ex Piliocolobus tephrosceles]